jgi:hypothetical protein
VDAVRSRAGACSPMMAAMAAEVTIRPACAARHRRAPETPTKKSADEPTGDGTDRTSDHQTRACTGSRTEHIGVGGWRNCQVAVIAFVLKPHDFVLKKV